MPAPPKLIRRLVIGPLVVGIELLVIAASPLLLLVAALLSPVFGGLRPVRMAVIVVSLLAHHLAAVAACLRLWLARPGPVGSDPEPVRDEYYAVLRGLIEASYRTIVRASRVQVRLCDSDDAEEVLRSPGPVVVLSRHAGEGDTLLAAHDLLSRYARRPRVVMHQLLRLDPVIDVLGSRLPNRFIDPRGGDIEHEIAELARDMTARDALLIFPEGGNSTAGRRRRGVERLERAGHDQEAGWARSMRYLTAPRPGGALAAIDAAPDPVVIFVAHAGFPCSFGEVWRLLPRRQTVEVRMWAVPAQEVPADREAAIGWLFGWWKTLDEWVGERYETRGR
jgi:1-acyl-sn-glycerol-3-phosphate acyltransferase